MSLAGLAELVDDGTGCLARRVMRPSRVGLEATAALPAVASEDGVPGLSAHTVASAERGEGKDPELEVTDEE
jgi:hypothetical protein